jgi:hypothetical protein
MSQTPVVYSQMAKHSLMPSKYLIRGGWSLSLDDWPPHSRLFVHPTGQTHLQLTWSSYHC